MDNLITFISKFQGIFGTLLGVTVTFVITQLSKRLGKLYFYFYDYSLVYYGKREDNTYGPIEDINKANSCYYKLRIQLYNSSEIIKVLKDFQIQFILEDKIVYSKPNNDNEKIQYTHHSEYKDFNFINILPKQLIEINLNGSIRDSDMIEISKLKKIYLITKNHKNRNTKKLIKKF